MEGRGPLFFTDSFFDNGNWIYLECRTDEVSALLLRLECDDVCTEAQEYLAARAHICADIETEVALLYEWSVVFHEVTCA